jgi:hypothetical protein
VDVRGAAAMPAERGQQKLKFMAAPAHPTDCRSPINSNSTPTFWLSSRAEPGNQHRRIFDAVARTASSLKRDRRFADSPLEEGVCCELVSEMGSPAAAGIRRDSEGFMG